MRLISLRYANQTKPNQPTCDAAYKWYKVYKQSSASNGQHKQ